MRTLLLAATFLLCLATPGSTQITSGFDAGEYDDMLWLAFYGIGDSAGKISTHTLNRGSYQRIFRSPEVGLFNKCEVYLRSDSVAIVSLRGTVNKLPSWLENFYSGMVPANGSMKLNDSTTFDYHLANNPNSLVHIGWLIGTGFLSRQYEPYLEVLLNRGIRSVIVTGFSQGGALTFLNTSHVYYKYSSRYPGLQVKALAGAAPKPGNLYYAYDFDHITANGWGYRVVNTADWVPETPVSVQTVNDFVDVNPITDAKATINKQKGMARIALKHVYNRMDKASYKAMKTLTKHLGRDVGKQVKKILPQLETPPLANSSLYMTAGSPVVLMADSAYHATFSSPGANVFYHHMYQPYRYLLQKQYALKSLQAAKF